MQVGRHADFGVDSAEVRLLLAHLAFQVDVALGQLEEFERVRALTLRIEEVLHELYLL